MLRRGSSILLLVLIFSFSAVFAQDGAKDQQIAQLQKQVQWLSRSREICEQSLTQVWTQGETFEKAAAAAEKAMADMKLKGDSDATSLGK